MRRSIGSAADFYRLRVLSVDTTDAVDFEWRDDILYRRPPETMIAEDAAFVVEAVTLDDEDVTYVLAAFEEPGEAHAWLADREEDLAEMTRMEFEDAYFPDDVAEMP